MSGDEIQRIIDEIHELRKDVRSDLEKVFERIDDQNNRIISAEKDIEYLKRDLDNSIDLLRKDLNGHSTIFKEFKEKGVQKIIESQIDKRMNKMIVLGSVNLFGLMSGIIGFLVYEFILKR